jgi:integral membrane protein
MNAALTRFRVIAYVVGVLLLVLTAGMVAKYGFDEPIVVEVVGPVHGFVYIVYLVLTADLARRAGWRLGWTILILLAGTVPFLSFVAERAVTTRVRAAELVATG